MTIPIVLASSSSIRATLLRNAGVRFTAEPARVDEESVKNALLAEGAPARDIADALAELKSMKISTRQPDAMVIGSDQVLELDGQLLSKPESPAGAIDQLRGLSGRTHILFSAVVLCEQSKPVWRHVSRVVMQMRDLSNGYLEDYVDRNWDRIRYSVGSYNLEEEGVRLFASVRGDYFSVLGMPLLETLNYLTLRGVLDT